MERTAEKHGPYRKHGRGCEKLVDNQTALSIDNFQLPTRFIILKHFNHYVIFTGWLNCELIEKFDPIISDWSMIVIDIHKLLNDFPFRLITKCPDSVYVLHLYV